jgi:ATP-dependent DNA helicase RecG
MHPAELREVGKNRASSGQARIVDLAGWLRPELLPVSGSRFADLSVERLRDYQRNRLGESELPETEAEWQRRLTRLGFMVSPYEGETVCTLAGLLLFGREVRAASGQDARFEATEDYLRFVLPRTLELSGK